MWRLLAVLIGGMLLDGYILGVIGPVTGPMKEDLGMSTWELGLVASMALFGILIGSPLGGWAGDKWGRKPLFMIDMALFWSGRYCSSSSARSRCCCRAAVDGYRDRCRVLRRLAADVGVRAQRSAGTPDGHHGPGLVRRIHDRLHGQLLPGAAGGAVADRHRHQHDYRGGLVDRPNRPARVAALVVDRAPLRRGPRHRAQVHGGRRRDDRRRARGRPHRRLRDAVLPARTGG